MEKYIQTSNYARCGNNPMAMAISYSCPEWYAGKRIAVLAPTWNLISGYKAGDISEADYTTGYLKILQERALTPQGVLDLVPDNAILLCYESPSEFCHRRVLAEWIYLNTGVEIPEWKNKTELEKEEQIRVVDSFFDF